IVGFAPALRLAGTSLKALINESGRTSTAGGAHRTLKSMVVAEIALAITLVAGAGWLVRSFSNLGSADPGFVSKGRLVFEVMLPPSRILPPGNFNLNIATDRLVTWTHEVEERLQAIGGVSAVATAATMPFGSDRDSVLYIGVQGNTIDPDHPLVARAHRVSDRFFEAVGNKVVGGRGFPADDCMGTAPVAVVNRTFARRYLNGRDPLTAKFTAGYPEVPAAPVYTIVGVVDDMKYVSLSQEADPAYYTPLAQGPFFFQTIVLKTALDNPASIAPSVRSAMKALDPLLPIAPQSFSAVVAASLRRQRLGMTLMLLFAVAALALAAVGIYGVIAYASAQRVGEVATRMALGATPGDVFWLLMNQGRLLAVVGTVVGVGVAYAAGRGRLSLLYGGRAARPRIPVTATLIVVALSSVAHLLPAQRVVPIEAPSV